MRWVAAAALAAVCAAPAHCADWRRSGFDDMGAATQAMQLDDTQNPAWLWVVDGERRFGPTCARCHDKARMRGVAAAYPAWDDELGKPVTLAARINLCRVRHVKAPPLAPDSDELLGLEGFVGSLSRGLPIRPPADPRLQPATVRGEALYRRPFGQLDVSCAQCHDANAGRKLGGSPIPQAHPTGYPIYRLEWQGPGGLQRRLRGCMAGVRAEPFDYGSDEFTAIELYLKRRAAGMLVETPAVRP